MQRRSLLAAGPLLPAWLAGCEPCGNSIAQSLTSPSGKWRAVVFVRDCGATTGFNTHLSVMAAERPLLPDATGNVLVHGKQLELRLNWASDQALQVTGASSIDAIRRESRVDSVKIRYLG